MLQFKDVLKHSSYPNGSYSLITPRINPQSYLEKTNNKETTKMSDRIWGGLELETS